MMGDFLALIAHLGCIAKELDSGLRKKFRVSPTAHKHNQARLT